MIKNGLNYLYKNAMAYLEAHRRREVVDAHLFALTSVHTNKNAIKDKTTDLLIFSNLNPKFTKKSIKSRLK